MYTLIDVSIGNARSECDLIYQMDGVDVSCCKQVCIQCCTLSRHFCITVLVVQRLRRSTNFSRNSGDILHIYTNVFMVPGTTIPVGVRTPVLLASTPVQCKMWQ